MIVPPVADMQPTARLSYTIAALAFGCVLLPTAGCDGRAITASNGRPGAGVLHSGVTSPIELGGASFTAPETAWRSLPSVPESTWVLISIPGSIEATRNPACGTQYSCAGAAAYLPFETTRPATYGPFGLAITRGGIVQEVPVRGTDGGGSGNAVALLYPAHRGHWPGILH